MIKLFDKISDKEKIALEIISEQIMILLEAKKRNDQLINELKELVKLKELESQKIIEKSSEEIYKMLETWEDPTLFNAFFNGDFEAGSIKGGGENIQKLVIKRLSPNTGYKIFETLGEVPFNKTLKHFSFKRQIEQLHY